MTSLSCCKGVWGGGERVERSEAETAADMMRGHESEARGSSETAPRSGEEEADADRSAPSEEMGEEGHDEELGESPAPKAMPRPRPVCPECGTQVSKPEE